MLQPFYPRQVRLDMVGGKISLSTRSSGSPMSPRAHSLVGQWVDSLAKDGKSPSTIKGYRRGIDHFATWYEQSTGEAFTPSMVIPRDVRDWIAFQQTVEGARPATINQRLAALSAFYRWAIGTGEVANDPTRGIKSLRSERHKPRALSKRELRRLRRRIYASGNLRDIAIFEFLLGTGLRVSEALSLKVRDISLGSRSGIVRVRRGKMGTSREIPLTKEVRRALREYLEAFRLQADDPLWIGQRGPLRDPSAINRILGKYAREAGLDGFTPHTLRHTFATRYLESHPGDIRTLAAILGHQDVRTTMIYTEPDLEEIARRMEEAEI